MGHLVPSRPSEVLLLQFLEKLRAEPYFEDSEMKGG